MDDFHFLRPWWLLALLPAGAIVWALAREEDPGKSWRQFVSPHLLPYLLVGQNDAGWLRPAHVLVLALFFSAVALAGPTWRREPSPFADDTASLVIVLKVTPSMLTADVQPTRLTRAVQKIHDLAALRPGGKTALIAYSGSAHRVMPLTRDAKIVETFAGELKPDVLPVEGDAAAAALDAAQRELARGKQAGWVLWIADTVAENQLAGLAEYRKQAFAPVSILAVDGAGMERDTLARGAAALGSPLVPVSADASDVERLIRGARFSTVAPADGGDRWQDAGYWFTPVLAFLAFLWFRPGWMLHAVAVE